MIQAKATDVLREFQSAVNAHGYEVACKTKFLQMLQEMAYEFGLPVDGRISHENLTRARAAAELIHQIQADRLQAKLNFGSDSIGGIIQRAWELVPFLPKELPPAKNSINLVVPGLGYAPHL